MSNKRIKKKIITGALIALILLITISTSQAAETFGQLNTDIAGVAENGTLTLDVNYTNTDNQDITISKNITIDGKGHTLNFNSESNKITINNEFTLTLKNLIITGSASQME